jgi:hypothetical protein
MYRLTFDTNTLINLFEFRPDEPTGHVVASIIGHALQGRVDIQITTRVEGDLVNDKEQSRYREITARIYRMFPVMASGFRVNGELADSGHKQIWNELQQTIFPTLSQQDKRHRNKVYDLDHLLGHYLNGREVFVTSDRDIRSKADTLRKTLKINVLSPEEVLRDLDSRALLDTTRKEPLPRRTDYCNPLPSGYATFDFTNNNKEFAVGAGEMLFDTHWSTRSSEQMAAYNYGESVEAIAVATGVSRLKDLKSMLAYDFTSSSRDISRDDILILKNTHGYYAAVQIRSMEVLDRGGSKNELSFVYVIQTNKTDDFSQLSWPTHKK